MSITVEAVYEDGVLKPCGPLPLKQHEKVQISIHPQTDLVQKTYGLLGWKGDAETIRRIALDPEFGIEEAP